MNLHHVRIESFAGFTEFELEIDPFTVLIGPNNGGKTSILRAIFAAIEVGRPVIEKIMAPQGQATSFFQGNIPNFQQLVARLGAADVDDFVYGRSKTGAFCIRLTYARANGQDVVITASMRRASGGPGEWTIGLSDGTNIVPIDKVPLSELAHIRAGVQQISPELVTDLGRVVPTEQVHQYSDLKSLIDRGSLQQNQRNQWQWWSEGKDPTQVQRVIDRIQEYLPDVKIRPPSRTKDRNSVVVNYTEGDNNLEIAVAGDGQRTLIQILFAVELSDAGLLLLDEPAAHLHPKMQHLLAKMLADSVTAERQIIVTSHSPDFIAACPRESVVWIDRSLSTARRCDDLGKALLDLGAINIIDAVEEAGADVVICFEGSPDERLLWHLFERCNQVDLAKRARFANFEGFGDMEHIWPLPRVLEKLQNFKIAVCAFRDSDYTATELPVSSEKRGEVLLQRFPCKEIENLFLMNADVIVKTMSSCLTRRSSRGHAAASPPNAELIRAKVSELSRDPHIMKAWQVQWLCRWATENKLELKDPAQHTAAIREFEERWEKDNWRIRFCPGGEVLSKLLSWLREEYKTSPTLNELIRHYDPSSEIRQLIENAAAHVNEVFSKAGQPTTDLSS